MEVTQITRQQCEPFIIGIHYAKRWPSISYAFGLVDKGEVIGVCTFGTPPSSPLRNGIAGAELAPQVLELNRLCLKYNRKNEASFLVSRALKMLPKNRIVISFADTSQGHQGTVYKAANFTYHGLSAKRTDWKVKGMEHLHGMTIADEFRGVKDRAAAMRAKYGDNFYLQGRPRKHRYIFVTGSVGFRRYAYARIKYPVV